jgi:hypothetical protein
MACGCEFRRKRDRFVAPVPAHEMAPDVEKFFSVSQARLGHFLSQ